MASIMDNNLSAILGKKLLKITDVANATGISRSTLTNLYYKRNKMISFAVIDKLCQFLDCSVSDLLGKEEVNQNDQVSPEP